MQGARCEYDPNNGEAYILTMPKFAIPQSTRHPPAALGPLPVPTGKGERLTGASKI